MELVELSPPTRMVSRIISDGMPFGGTWTIEVHSEGAVTTVTITENGEVYNPIFRFVSKFVMGHHRTSTTYLRDLGRRFDQDVEVVVVR